MYEKPLVVFDTRSATCTLIYNINATQDLKYLNSKKTSLPSLISMIHGHCSTSESFNKQMSIAVRHSWKFSTDFSVVVGDKERCEREGALNSIRLK